MKYKPLPINKTIKFLIPSLLLFVLSLTSVYLFCSSYIWFGIFVLLVFGLPATYFFFFFLLMNSYCLRFDDSIIVYHHCFLRKDISFNVNDSLVVYIPDERLMNSRKLRLIINNNGVSYVFRIDKDTISFIKEKYSNNIEYYLTYSEAIKYPIKKNNAKWLMITGGIVEGCILHMPLIIMLVYLLCPPITFKTKVDDYHYIYDVVNDSNKLNTPGFKRKTLLGYGEYMYNSFLILTPRKAPTSLSSFCFRWRPLIDFDELAYCFECKLDELSFNNYKNGLEEFKLTIYGVDHYLLKDEEHFRNTAYIVQWLTPCTNNQVSLEYILLDSENFAVTYVYSLFNHLDELENKSSYVIKPNVNLENVIGNRNNIDDGFSIYLPDGMTKKYYDVKLSINDLEFDNSFLKWLQ